MEMTIFFPVSLIKYWSGAVRVNIPYGGIFFGCLKQTFLESSAKSLKA
jgi:hypothetical protein